MIALAIAAVLIARTYAGNISVQEGLSDHACAEAASVAQYGVTLEEEAAREAAAAAERAKRLAEGAAKDPKEKAQCEARQTAAPALGMVLTCGPEPIGAIATWPSQVRPNDIVSARCAK